MVLLRQPREATSELACKFSHRQFVSAVRAVTVQQVDNMCVVAVIGKVR